MCGIVGNITDKPIKNMLMNGLAGLEYRGYDSVGLATIGSDNKISIIKNKGKIKDFVNKYKNTSLEGNMGIGHTRWATHGIPSETNAHPIYDYHKNLAVVHNGIIENYIEIKEDLIKEGFEFFTDTDTECIANLISSFLRKNFNMIDSIAKTSERILGHAAVLIISEYFPSTIFGFKKGFAGSILISKNNGEISISSDLQALSFDKGDYVVLEDNEIFSAESEKVNIYSNKNLISKDWKKIDGKDELVTKGKYKYFMEKEIHEQPKVFLDNFSGRIDFANKTFKEVYKEFYTEEGSFYVDTFWLNVNRYRDFNYNHNHGGHDWSFIYYIKIPEGCGNVVFVDPRIRRMGRQGLLAKNIKDNYFSHDQFYVPASEGLIVFFPSYLEHYVQPNETKNPRISLSGNINLEI